MNASQTVHPTDQTLQAYGLGKLDDGSAQSVGNHLESCSECRRRVAELSSDSFLGRLRGAQGRPNSPGPNISATAGRLMLAAGLESTAPPPAGTLPPGLSDYPDYEITQELGRGGMGVVYLARNTLMGRMEVLKVVGSHLISRRGVADRFLAEIRNAARLHHPNIVTAYSALRVGESLVLAMEHVDGLDLAKIVETRGPLPVAHACNYAHQAALGLQHAHEHGMVHRDIKPGNLMLARQSDRALIKVLDFGLAKVQSEGAVDGGLTHEGQMLGTPAYIAPEQIDDARRADIRADIYSLGCTLYYLLTGGPPFQGRSLYDILQAHHSMEATPLNLARPEVPVELAALVAKMMAKEPERRFQEPKEVAQALTPFFKKGSLAFMSPQTDMSHASQASSHRPLPGVTSTPTQPIMHDAGPIGKQKRTAEPSASETQWKSLIDVRETQRTQAGTPAIAPARRPLWIWPSVAVGVLLLALVVVWAVVIRVKTSNGVIELVNLPEDAKVYVDGEKATVSWLSGGKSAVISVSAGKHKVSVKKDGLEVSGAEVTVRAEGKEEFTVRLVPPVAAPVVKGKADDRPARSEADKASVPPSVERAGDNMARAQANDSKQSLNKRASVLSGSWRLEGNELVQNGGEGTILLGDTPLSSFDIKFQGQVVSGNEGFVALFHRTSAENVRFFHVGEAGGKRADLGFLYEGKEGGQSKQISLAKGRWYNVMIKVRGVEFWCYLEGQELFHDLDERFAKGRIGLATWDADARFRDIVITTPEGKTLWEGPPELPPTPVVKRETRPAAPASKLTEKISLPPTRLVLFDEFNGPQTGLLKDLSIPHEPDHGRSDGVFFAYSTQGWLAWNMRSIRSDGTCEVVARVESEKGRKTSAWSVIVASKSVPRGFLIKINAKGELSLEPSPWKKAEAFRQIDPRMGPIVHPAIKPGNEFNKLLLFMRKREVVIFVNGVQICDPVRFDYDVTPAELQFGATGSGKKRAEFDRVEIRELMQPQDTLRR